jgi:(E)-4-hydroxy-3-methylbut-2-enyl-diphosphate synthase
MTRFRQETGRDGAMTRWKYDGFAYRRRPTRTVYIGEVAVGSEHPIRIQSMTTPSTRDTEATARQIERLVESGCEIVRVTVPTTGDAESLPSIRRELERRGVRVPLVADIHFTPAAALKAIEHVEKIRINPGNYADKKKFAVREYTEAEYAEELERIAKVFSPLVKRAKELGVSMRIGTNHGSLSDRIMNRYGDTPEGMVESALEFVRICEDHGYRDLVLSMKASNPVVVLQVYRLLAHRLAEEGMDYPFHLGVTEAGDGEDGRVKSAIGIGALLDEGIGDTIRVSLTEDPVAEVPVARALAEPFNRLHRRPGAAVGPPGLGTTVTEERDPFSYERRCSAEAGVGPRTIGGTQTVLVEVPLTAQLSDADTLRRELDRQVGARVPEETRAELISVDVNDEAELEALEALRRSMELVAPGVALSARVDATWLGHDEARSARWLAAAHRLHLSIDAARGGVTHGGLNDLFERAAKTGRAILAEVGSSDGQLEAAVDRAAEVARLAARRSPCPLILALSPTAAWSPLHGVRLLAARLAAAGQRSPVLLLDRPEDRGADPLLGPAAALGGLLCDGIGDAIQVVVDSAEASRRTAFGILQGSRVRITRTEFISCPSCGRTLFDLEETTARIKARTAHLKGVKIAVMGCVVNGPGEMADADFGYVGWGEDKIALFVGKELVAKNIPTAEADERLVQLIKQHGRWVDPPVPAAEEA